MSGTGAYALLTSPVVERFGVRVDGALPMTAEYEHYEPLETWLYRLRHDG